jgi:hypothetical protein
MYQANFQPAVKIFPMSHSFSNELAWGALLFTATLSVCSRLPRHMVLSTSGPLPAAYRDSGPVLIRSKASTTNYLLAVAWFDLPARTYYGSIKQVRSASTSLFQFDWLRRNACIRAVHEACALDAYSLVSPVNTLLAISRHTVLICILTPMLDPYWTTSGIVLVAHRLAFLPSLPTILSGSVKILVPTLLSDNSPCVILRTHQHHALL